ncbi:uncharacterized protein LOC107981886 isoform X2 [Nasonia vitripennis]|uniref:Uncharacterized protein n=1 Tax=Nasonia vitripennis TaxID=7425 RepID=A0A7M7QDU6_NASVI|nr:uncharacterized protein LOC107981886 isoform X2 [Nasonia vitripennis]
MLNASQNSALKPFGEFPNVYHALKSIMQRETTFCTTLPLSPQQQIYQFYTRIVLTNEVKFLTILEFAYGLMEVLEKQSYRLSITNAESGFLKRLSDNYLQVQSVASNMSHLITMCETKDPVRDSTYTDMRPIFQGKTVSPYKD